MSKWTYRTPGERAEYEEVRPPKAPRAPMRASTKWRAFGALSLVSAIAIGHVLIMLDHRGVSHDYVAFWGVLAGLLGLGGPMVGFIAGSEAAADEKRGIS